MALELHILIEKENDLYSSLCLELNVASQGKSVDEAKENMKEAIMLYMEDVYEAGDEKEFIPRPAPVEEWLKYFKQKALEIKNDVLKKNTPILSEVVIG
ncbi:MAG TPA: hypothetical protein VJ440_06235 [Candidatus Brocadiaceae bacterium]|nr:hypothetical protein [Candidatus Brocadiaceae bacterium]